MTALLRTRTTHAGAHLQEAAGGGGVGEDCVPEAAQAWVEEPRQRRRRPPLVDGDRPRRGGGAGAVGVFCDAQGAQPLVALLFEELGGGRDGVRGQGAGAGRHLVH